MKANPIFSDSRDCQTNNSQAQAKYEIGGNTSSGSFIVSLWLKTMHGWL
jgi:hypothetical protein